MPKNNLLSKCCSYFLSLETKRHHNLINAKTDVFFGTLCLLGTFYNTEPNHLIRALCEHDIKAWNINRCRIFENICGLQKHPMPRFKLGPCDETGGQTKKVIFYLFLVITIEHLYPNSVSTCNSCNYFVILRELNSLLYFIRRRQ